MQRHAVYELVICLWPCLHNVVLVGTWCEHMPDADGHAHIYNNVSVPASWPPTGETDCDQATQSFHRFGTRAVDLWHHQLDILGLNALLIHFALLQSCTMCTPAAQERQHLNGTNPKSNSRKTPSKLFANCVQALLQKILLDLFNLWLLRFLLHVKCAYVTSRRLLLFPNIEMKFSERFVHWSSEFNSTGGMETKFWKLIIRRCSAI